jgi:hypothetical protein
MGMEYSPGRRKRRAKIAKADRFSQARGGPVVVRKVGEPVPADQPPAPAGYWSRR